MRSVASVRFHGALWNTIDITRLSYLEFKGTDLLSPPPIPNIQSFAVITLMSASLRHVGKTPTSAIPPMQLVLIYLSQGLFLGKLNPKTLTLVTSLILQG